MDIHYILCLIAILLVPGIYASYNKHFLVSRIPEYNHFLIRLMLIAPILAGISFVFSIFFWTMPLWGLSITMDFTPITLWGPVFADILLIYGLDKWFLPASAPEILSRHMIDYSFYLFAPDIDSALTDSKINGTKFERVYKNQIKPRGVPPLEKQLTETIVSYHEIKGKNMGISIRGDLIVSENGLEILQSNQITGFYMVPVKLSFVKKRTMFTAEHPEDRKYEGLNGERYFRVLSTSTLPPLAPKTKYVIKEDGIENWGSVVFESKYYYYIKDLSCCCDINDTHEYFIPGPLGAYIQKFRVISKKMKQLMISDFNYTEEDFLPIYLVDENENIIDQSKNSDSHEMTEAPNLDICIQSKSM